MTQSGHRNCEPTRPRNCGVLILLADLAHKLKIIWEANQYDESGSHDRRFGIRADVPFK
jgi:hypothetical protein